MLFFSVVTVRCLPISRGGDGEQRVQPQRYMARVEAGHADACMASSALEQPGLGPEGVLGACIECCVYQKGLGFVLVSLTVEARVETVGEGMSPVLCGSGAC